jgi:hypothetical protein
MQPPSEHADSYAPLRKESKKDAKRPETVGEVLAGCALTIFLGIVGAYLGLFFLSGLFVTWMQPQHALQCGMWVIVPCGIASVVGGLVGILCSRLF